MARWYAPSRRSGVAVTPNECERVRRRRLLLSKRAFAAHGAVKARGNGAPERSEGKLFAQQGRN